MKHILHPLTKLLKTRQLCLAI